MKVQTACDWAGVAETGAVFTHAKGDVVDLPQAEAERAIKNGVAKLPAKDAAEKK